MNTICTRCGKDKDSDNKKTCLSCREYSKNYKTVKIKENDEIKYLTKEDLENVLTPLYDEITNLKQIINNPIEESIKESVSEITEISTTNSNTSSKTSNEDSLKKFSIKDKIENKEIRIDFIHPFTAKLYGTRGSGKTTWIINYLNNIKDSTIFNEVMFITNSESQELFKLLQVPIKFKKPEEFTKIEKYKQPVLYIFDDCMQDLRFNKEVQNIYTRGRHNNISIFSLEQHINYSNNVERGNTDYFLIFKINDVTALDLFHRKFCSELLFDNFIKMIRFCNNNTLPLIISNTDYRIKYRYNFNYKIDSNCRKEKIIKELILKDVTEYKDIKVKRNPIVILLLLFCFPCHDMSLKHIRYTYKTIKETKKKEVYC